MKLNVFHSYRTIEIEATSLCDTTRNNITADTQYGWIAPYENLLTFYFKNVKMLEEGYPEVITTFVKDALSLLYPEKIDSCDWQNLKKNIMYVISGHFYTLGVKESDYYIIQNESDEAIQEFLDFNIYPHSLGDNYKYQ